MSAQKKLDRGWYNNLVGELRFVVGYNSEGNIVYQSDSLSMHYALPCSMIDLDSWAAVPNCTGWDWEPSLVPVRGRKVATAKVRLTPEMSTGWTCPDCGEHSDHGHEDVCPMAWVVQDRVPPRSGVDEVKWSDQPDKSYLVSAGGSLMHGQTTAGIAASMCVRCRRKDLPQMPETTVEESLKPKRTTVVLIGRRSGEVRWAETDESRSVHDVEIKHDGTRFYVEEP